MVVMLSTSKYQEKRFSSIPLLLWDSLPITGLKQFYLSRIIEMVPLGSFTETVQLLLEIILADLLLALRSPLHPGSLHLR
jgi:TM2 domain-containing membrane protein YozV